MAEMFKPALAGRRLDPADARRNAAFRQYGEDSDIAGAGDVRTTTELHGVMLRLVQCLAHCEDADDVAILFAEKRKCALFNGFVRRHFRGGDLRILADDGIHLILDRFQFFARDRLAMAEVKAKTIGLNK